MLPLGPASAGLFYGLERRCVLIVTAARMLAPRGAPMAGDRCGWVY